MSRAAEATATSSPLGFNSNSSMDQLLAPSMDDATSYSNDDHVHRMLQDDLKLARSAVKHNLSSSEEKKVDESTASGLKKP